VQYLSVAKQERESNFQLMYVIRVEVVKGVMGWTKGAAEKGAAERALPGRAQGKISSVK
jgi:hypothetical protein